MLDVGGVPTLGPTHACYSSKLHEHCPDVRVFIDMDSIEPAGTRTYQTTGTVDFSQCWRPMISTWAIPSNEQEYRRLDTPAG